MCSMSDNETQTSRCVQLCSSCCCVLQNQVSVTCPASKHQQNQTHQDRLSTSTGPVMCHAACDGGTHTVTAAKHALLMTASEIQQIESHQDRLSTCNTHCYP